MAQDPLCENTLLLRQASRSLLGRRGGGTAENHRGKPGRAIGVDSYEGVEEAIDSEISRAFKVAGRDLKNRVGIVHVADDRSSFPKYGLAVLTTGFG